MQLSITFFSLSKKMLLRAETLVVCGLLRSQSGIFESPNCSFASEKETFGENVMAVLVGDLFLLSWK